MIFYPTPLLFAFPSPLSVYPTPLLFACLTPLSAYTIPLLFAYPNPLLPHFLGTLSEIKWVMHVKCPHYSD